MGVDLNGHEWRQDGAGWTLILRGDWCGDAGTRLTPPPAAARQVSVDARALGAWDGGLAAALHQCLAPLHQRAVPLQLQDLPPGVRSVLELALSVVRVSAPERAAAPVGVAAIGHRLAISWVECMATAAFFGEVLIALGRLLRGRSDLQGVDLWRQVDQAGPLSVPIVSLTCFLVGLMLAYMGGAQLHRIGAPSFIPDVVTVGMVRELAGLMTGVILAGRLGAAFAAQIGSMQAGEEIDALRALGVDPIGYLVLPRLLALLLVAPMLVAIGMLVGVLAGLPAAVAAYGLSPTEYLHKSAAALTWTHLWIGLFKGMMYLGLVALAGCREGLRAGRDAQAVGAATTTAVVKALVWIVAAACGSTVVLQSLGF
ncbi:protein of unknown function DUF140 [Leptothrix cholodnii SP-6]|uniref:ABC transporter permease n=1 Tax=Leptothrix cholodnii (strain ATCC 51168 / LMG 8142 / SP-6) TaxID=395495 RepID=B1XY77_LEPCP|nr:ABC transporter permease [Leptothrix cholodnii]ACB33978.1 protein of unknown function DUF140 [Leptothrix cholodnii SP-6]